MRIHCTNCASHTGPNTVIVEVKVFDDRGQKFQQWNVLMETETKDVFSKPFEYIAIEERVKAAFDGHLQIQNPKWYAIAEVIEAYSLATMMERLQDALRQPQQQQAESRSQ